MSTQIDCFHVIVCWLVKSQWMAVFVFFLPEPGTRTSTTWCLSNGSGSLNSSLSVFVFLKNCKVLQKRLGAFQKASTSTGIAAANVRAVH